MCLCWSNWLVCIPMIINRFTFRQWWNLVKYRNTVNIWCWPEKWLRTTAAAVWKVYHLTYNSIHNMTHHSQNSVRQLELSWKLFLVYLLSIWSVSMGDFWVLRRWGFCVWGDKRRRGGGRSCNHLIDVSQHVDLNYYPIWLKWKLVGRRLLCASSGSFVVQFFGECLHGPSTAPMKLNLSSSYR